MISEYRRAVSHGGDENEYFEPETEGEPILNATVEIYKVQNL